VIWIGAVGGKFVILFFVPAHVSVSFFCKQASNAANASDGESNDFLVMALKISEGGHGVE
jgi:hypothetical protein